MIIDMLTTNQLVQIFSKSKRIEEPPSTESIVEIMKYANIEPGIDNTGMNYFCSVSLLELSKSEAPDDLIYEMAQSGWVLSKDRKKIINFYG